MRGQKVKFVAVFQGHEAFGDIFVPEKNDRIDQMSYRQAKEELARKAVEQAGIRNERGDFSTVKVELFKLTVASNGASVERTSVNPVEIQPYQKALTEAGFESEQEELLKDIPEEFRPFIREKAWHEGHSAGYEEVLSYVRGLVHGLKDPIAKYAAKISQEARKMKRK
jgi:flagellar biosynthesis/type III secretory pathway protein FliH